MKPALHRSSGIALVVTLILLAIITFMTVTLLVLSRSQRNMVASSSEQARAAEAAKLGLRHGLAEALAPVKALTNLAAIDLKVSTNFINTYGFDITRTKAFDPLNVSYAYPNGQPVTGNDFLRNVANLYFYPRAPVYVNTNRLFPGSNDFRFYVDLNRNGRFDTNGWLPELNDFMQPVTYATNGVVVTNYNFYVGDPEWVGVLEKPEYPHSSSNLFVMRYAYIIIPASKTLDLNYIHNYAKGVYSGFSPTMPSSQGDGFMRNQGVGTFEINLGAFLVDLNSNYWPYPNRDSTVSRYWWPVATPPFAQPYVYNPVFSSSGVLPNNGAAFNDAAALVRYRYSGNAGNLVSARNFFGPNPALSLVKDPVDIFAAGPVMTNTTWFNTSMSVSSPFPGSYNPYHFYTHQDFFDTTKTSPTTAQSPYNPYNLTTRLLSAGAGSNYYNRYTYYRMLAQLGTDSGNESPKININYVNVDNRGNIVPYLATNSVPWIAEQFFTNTANRLLAQAGYTFNTTGIQIYPTNFYTASVHRILQMTANIFDASTNRSYNGIVSSNGFPTVFRPIFLTTHTNGTMVFIVNYKELTDHATFLANPPIMRDLALTNFPAGPLEMVRGIPLVMGARKGLPNFNNFELRSKVEVTRKLEFLKHFATDTYPYMTNQMYMLSISNEFGLDMWNSYTNLYPRNLQLTMVAANTASMSNEFSRAVYTNNFPFANSISFVTNQFTIPAYTWAGFSKYFPSYSFISLFRPAINNFMFLPPASYSSASQRLIVPYQTSFEVGQGFPIPHWWLNLRSSLLLVLYDTQARRIVDYVNLESINAPFDITANLFNGGNTNYAYTADGKAGSMWVTNRIGGSNAPVSAPTYGILNQIGVSLGAVQQSIWNPARGTLPLGWDTRGAINFFRANLANLPPLPGAASGPQYLTNRFSAPYAPTRDMYLYTSWQANDPLVHYTIGDLVPLSNTNICDWDISIQQAQTLGTIGGLTYRYEPWGYSMHGGTTVTDVRVKDPLVTQSSDWEFPTNQSPSIGWLGRIHRGTPWQTIYLKSSPAPLVTWQTWSGNGRVLYNMGQINTNVQPYAPINRFYYDAILSSPTNDWRLLDMFTAALGDNTTRGQLSVNQTNLAAWSALLSGVVVKPDNNPADYTIIQPAGTYSPTLPPPLVTIYNAINDVRRTNYAGAFKGLGDILAVPELTINSPFLNNAGGQVSDAVMERLPQQVLGLLKGGEQPRFVVYSYGQALKPADRARVLSGPYSGLCTNYQITAEVTTRSVVRIDGAPSAPRATVESFNVLPPD